MQVYEYTFRRHKIAEVPQAAIHAPTDAARVIGSLMLEDLERESLLVLNLNAKNRVIGVSTAYSGNVSSALVRIGELFRDAIRLDAVGIILVHNHPSGDPTPSPDDLHLTAEAIEAGRLLDIDVLDHVIVAEGDVYVSLRDRGIQFARRT